MQQHPSSPGACLRIRVGPELYALVPQFMPSRHECVCAPLSSTLGSREGKSCGFESAEFIARSLRIVIISATGPLDLIRLVDNSGEHNPSPVASAQWAKRGRSEFAVDVERTCDTAAKTWIGFGEDMEAACIGDRMAGSTRESHAEWSYGGLGCDEKCRGGWVLHDKL